MTPDEVRALYAKIASYDYRKPSQANLAAWGEQAVVGRWTLQEALDAVREHHRVDGCFIMPAHIHAIIRARRQLQPSVDELRLLDAAPPADPETRKRIMSIVGEAFAMPAKRECKPEPKSADEARKLEQARAELDELRKREEGAS